MSQKKVRYWANVRNVAGVLHDKEDGVDLSIHNWGREEVPKEHTPEFMEHKTVPCTVDMDAHGEAKYETLKIVRVKKPVMA